MIPQLGCPLHTYHNYEMDGWIPKVTFLLSGGQAIPRIGMNEWVSQHRAFITSAHLIHSTLVCAHPSPPPVPGIVDTRPRIPYPTTQLAPLVPSSGAAAASVPYGVASRAAAA
ncbi:hypothetical protein VTJ83DRAFT_2667 [Remersonia thermophila]|uniref:Uncharacterized protein n=1 Tax=Remersonia thermophila TaxID=72144 RepID=A0ABR4DJF4_9PEZI